jgi:response regulator RpfG family c-di-GMP phosphodiesterase
VNDRILCVDDDPNILQAYQRTLRKQFRLEPALGGKEGLEAVQTQGPYAVIVADMRMPDMDGVQLLSQVRQIAPDTVRMMLTGNADQQTAIDAVNEGHIFRFLNKPCPPDIFGKALTAALEQHRLITAEKELLSKTLSGSVKLLTEVLGLVNPTAFGRASRVHAIVKQLCEAMGVEKSWQIEIAAMLSQIGCVSIPHEILEKIYRREGLSQAETHAFRSHPEVARGLLARIPRLEEVAELVAHQDYRIGDMPKEGQSLPPDGIPLGSRILKVALDWDTLISGGADKELALATMNDRSAWYDSDALVALRKILGEPEVRVVRRVQVHDLIDGAILVDDVRSLRRTLLCARGHEVTPSLRARLASYAATVGIQDWIHILVPRDKVADVIDQPAPRVIPSPTEPRTVEVADDPGSAPSEYSRWFDELTWNTKPPFTTTTQDGTTR